MSECAFCGHSDANHRIADNIRGRHQAGDTIASIADDFEMTAEEVQAVLDQEGG